MLSLLQCQERGFDQYGVMREEVVKVAPIWMKPWDWILGKNLKQDVQSE